MAFEKKIIDNDYTVICNMHYFTNVKNLFQFALHYIQLCKILPSMVINRLINLKAS